MSATKVLHRAKIEIIDASNSDTWQNDVKDLVSNISGVSGVFECRVFEHLLEAVATHAIQAIVIEREYVDADYLQIFAQHYSRSFRKKHHHCLRMHFFGCAVAAADLIDNPNGLATNYRGFAVIRPTGRQFVSRSILTPPHDQPMVTVNAKAKFTVHLLGHKYVIEASPFIQQDANTFICAGAAMWTVALLMHECVRTPRVFPGQVNQLALKHFSNAQLRKGLSVEQIVMTLREIGVSPHVELYSNLLVAKKEFPEAHLKIMAKILEVAHVFAESGFPPILAFASGKNGHAVTVVGYERSSTRNHLCSVGTTGDSISSADFVQNLIVMDDADGPYRRFGSMQPPSDNIDNVLAKYEMLAVIVPVPAEVCIEYEDVATEYSTALLAWANVVKVLEEIEAVPEGQYKLIADSANPFVTRPRLWDSREWKISVCASGMPREIKAAYRSMLLPKYIWVISISDSNRTSSTNGDSQHCFGEVVLDATANPHTKTDSLLSCHVRGLLVCWTDTPNERAVEWIVEKSDWY